MTDRNEEEGEVLRYDENEEEENVTKVHTTNDVESEYEHGSKEDTNDVAVGRSDNWESVESCGGRETSRESSDPYAAAAAAAACGDMEHYAHYSEEEGNKEDEDNKDTVFRRA